MSNSGKPSKERLERLKEVFRKAQEEGEDSLKTGSKELRNNPDKAALFTLLAGNIIHRSKSQER